MADILTKLQTCLDQLATQLYSTTCYLSLRHPLLSPPAIPSDPYTLPAPAHTLVPGPEDSDPSNPRSLRPDAAATFEASQRELARDLIVKAAQIEQLVAVLPGIGTSAAQQEARIAELEGELREMERRRREKRREMRILVERLDGVVVGMGRSRGVVLNRGDGVS